MSRIATTTSENARGWRRLVIWGVKRQYGGVVPGIIQTVIGNLRIALPLQALYSYLHERKRSPLSRLQREMVATVVNGAIGGAP
ncbi:MAG TPA: hypothetical protein VFQ36_17200 [Ktedonobacteraceae bacterium]|nr:hypothetical protein [Ktedonobacteraceae bacterium]